MGACAGLRLPVVFFRTNTVNDPAVVSTNPTSTTPTGESSDNIGQHHVQNLGVQKDVVQSPTSSALDAAAGAGVLAPHSHRKQPSAVLNKGLSTTEGLITAMLLSNPSYRAKFGSSGGGGGGMGGQREEDLDQLQDAAEEEKVGASSREGAGVGASPSLPGTAPEPSKGQGLGAHAVAGEYLEQMLTDFHALSASRRERLLPIDARLWLSHLSQSNPLQFDELLQVRGMFSEARASYIELFGSLLMAFGVQVAEALERLRLLEAEMIGGVKAPDARWQFVCQLTQEKLSSLSSTSGHTKEQVTPLPQAYILPPPPCRRHMYYPPLSHAYVLTDVGPLERNI